MIKILCVGKIKDDYLTKGIKEYSKRMESWKGIEVVEVKEYNSTDHTKVIEIEGDYLLEKINKDCLIIDLASKPGGVDFDKAKELGIKTNWALGLPGKVAAKTAAKYMKRIIEK